MEFFNVLKGLRKSNSESKGLSERLSFGRKSLRSTNAKSIANSPLPPLPNIESGTCKTKRCGKVFENPPADLVFGPSLHSPRHDTKAGVNKDEESLVIKGTFHECL